jgi:hypothetical protein
MFKHNGCYFQQTHDFLDASDHKQEYKPRGGFAVYGSPEAEEDGVPTSPPIYRYFLEKFHRSVSLALMRGTACMLPYAPHGM